MSPDRATGSGARRVALLARAAFFAALLVVPRGTGAAPVPGAPETAPDPVFAAARAALQAPAVRFCREATYPLSAEELAWCPGPGQQADRCPLLADACRRGATATVERGERRDGRSRFPFSLPDLGAFGQILFWSLVVLAAAALLWLLVRQLGARPADDPGEAPTAPADDTAAREAAARAIVETDVERLLARAHSHAATGENTLAIGDLHAAMLRRLEGEGLVRVHPGRTNGDYLRDLRPRPALRDAVRGVVRDVERVQFGGAPATPDLYPAVLQRVLPVARGVLLGALLLLLPGCGLLDLRGDFDRSPSGSAVVEDFLRRTGFEVRQRHLPLADGTSDVDQIVLLPGLSPDAATWEELLRWVRRSGGSLIVAGGVERLPAALGIATAPTTEAAALGTPELERAGLGDLHLVAPSHLVLALGPETGRGGTGFRRVLAARARRPWAVEVSALGEDGRGRLLVLADDGLFQNGSLAAGDDALLLARILEPGGRRLELCGELVGRSSDTPAEAIKRARLAPFVAQLLGCLALLFVARGAAFGRLREGRVASRRRFIEHARALAAAYRRARASRHALALYGAWALERLRERATPADRRSLSTLAEAVASRTGRPLGQVMAALVEAGDPRRDGFDPDDEGVGRALSQILFETGGRR